MQRINDIEIAIDMLINITEINKYKHISIKTELNEYGNIKNSSRNLIIKLVYNVVNNIIFVDYIIDQFVNVENLRQNPFILNLFRISVFQMMFEPNVSKSDILYDATTTAKGKLDRKGVKYVNSVIKSIISNKNNIEFPNKEDEINYISIMFSYPIWIVKYWINVLGYETVLDICKENRKEPEISVYLNTSLLSRRFIKNSLLNDNLEFSEDEKIKNLVVLHNFKNTNSLESYANGLFYFIDRGMVNIINILNPNKNSQVLSINSSIESANYYLANKINEQGFLTIIDNNKMNLNRIEKNINRLKINNIKVLEIDATTLVNKFINKFDYVVVEPPSTNLGCIKKRPNIKYQFKFSDLKYFVEIQRAILATASNYVKIGGKLMYITTTISSKENVENMNWFVENYKFEIKEIHNILPGVNDNTSDGIFVCLLQRKK